MGLRAAFAAAASAAFNAFGDIVDNATYYGGSANDTYDPATGAVTDGTSGRSIKIILTYFKRHELDSMDVLATDTKGLVRQSDLTVTPRVDDTITIGSDTYRVKYFRMDPAHALWTFVLRKA